MKNFIVSIFVFGITFLSWGQGEFVTVWDLSNANSALNKTRIEFHTTNSGAINYTWEEISPGNSSGQGTFLSGSDAVRTISNLPYESIIRLKIHPTNLQAFRSRTGGGYGSWPANSHNFHSSCIIDVESWGNVNWMTMEQAFDYCVNLNISANDTPNLTSVTSLRNMFRHCYILNSPSNINNWNVSNVTDMYAIFQRCFDFNQPLNNWDVSNVQNMQWMFHDARSFNQPVNDWSTSSVTNMVGLFEGAWMFNQYINSWDVVNVSIMAGMFANASSFNQDLSSWNVSNVTNMVDMFYGNVPFNQDISGWNVSNVTDMRYMFAKAFWLNLESNGFNQDISSWDVSNVTNMSFMFYGNRSFNQNLGNWTLNSSVNLNQMLSLSKFDCENYALTLLGWQANNPNVFNRNLGAVGLKYSSNAQSARNNLVNLNGWTINDAGVTNCDSFETIWDLSNAYNSSNSSIEFSILNNGNQKIYWEEISPGTNSGVLDLAYNPLLQSCVIDNLPPNSTIKLSLNPSNLKSFETNPNHSSKLIEISRWGNADWSSFENAFANCQNMTISATDIPNLLNLTNSSNMFSGCSSINYIPSVELWQTANNEDMSFMFYGVSNFNQNLGSWLLNPNVNMTHMLSLTNLDCFNYASTLSGWASNNPTVTNRNLGATGLNFAQFGNQARNTLINSRGWTITDSGQSNCGEFVTYWTMNQPGAHANELNFNVGFTDTIQYTWIHVGGNTSGSGYFTNPGAQILTGIPTNADIRLVMRPQNLEHFSINNGPDRKRLFYVESWGNAVWKNMEGMFYGCESLIQNTSVGFPNTSQVNSMKNMFRNCSNVLEIVSPWLWDVSSVANMESMFEGASQFDSDLSQWNVANVINFNSMFKGASSFNSWLNDWQTDNATDMADMFYGATQFQSDLDNWQTYNVTNMKNMFRGASQFQGNISNWLTDNVTDMSGMFYGASLFNSNISNWNTYQVTNMADMFRNASSFDQELNAWSVDQVTSFSRMFMNASSFKRTLHNWNTTNGQYFDNMFNGASIFDGEVNTWDMSNAITVSGMFANTQAFNREIGTWNFPLVEDMTSMFQNATSFNRDLSLWTFPSATNLSQMFSGASQFNQNLSNWNVSGIHQMIGIFENAGAFNQNLGSWQFFPSVEMNNMLNNSGLDCHNYGATLSGWLANNPNLMSRNLDANNLEYGLLGEIARDILVNTQGWNISGDNFVSTNPYVLNDGETFSAQLGCYGEFTRTDDPNERLVLIDPNGNSINLNSFSVLATNDFLTPSDPEIVPIQSGGSGYYEITDGVNTFRVGKRMFKIEAPGNFTANGGVRVRLYYDQNDLTGLVNDPAPNGNIANYGWFKSSASSFQSAIDEINASPAQLPSAIGLIPVYGNENGVEYVEFLVESFSVFGMYAQTIDAPLPVTLTTFNANCLGETIQINWTTASEFNASHYVIQSSRDGSVWTDLGEVAAAGATNQATNYNFETPNFGGLSYFRLVQVDLDGASEIFRPVSANCELENNSMTVYPNQTAENFTVRIETKESFENATLELIDNMGRVVLSRTLNINAGTTTLPFDSRDLQPGVYILTMRGEGEKFKPVQVVRI